MKAFRSVLVVLVALLSLIGCDNHIQTDDHGIPYFTDEDYESLEKSLSQATFRCASNEKCPENVGMIFANKSGVKSIPQLAQCTGFLISDDIVATNSHCIPDYLKQNLRSCEGYISIRFIGPGGQKRIYGCRELLDFSDLNTSEFDYAFFKVKATGIEPISLSKNGIKDNQEIIVPRVNPVGTQGNGQLHVAQCKVLLGSYLNFPAADSWSETGSGAGCSLIGGNSGSPVLNEAGQAVGIVQSAIDKQDDEDLPEKIQWGQHEIYFPEVLPDLFFFTNLSCVKDPVTQRIDEEQCARAKELNMIKCLNYGDTKSDSLERMQSRWQADLPPTFLYDFDIDDPGNVIVSQPICVNPQANLKEFNELNSSSAFVTLEEKAITAGFPQRLVYGFRTEANEYFKVDSDFEYTERLRIDSLISLEKDSDGHWKGFLSLMPVDSAVDSPLDLLVLNFVPEEVQVSLPECTKEQLEAQGAKAEGQRQQDAPKAEKTDSQSETDYNHPICVR